MRRSCRRTVGPGRRRRPAPRRGSVGARPGRPPGLRPRRRRPVRGGPVTRGRAARREGGDLLDRGGQCLHQAAAGARQQRQPVAVEVRQRGRQRGGGREAFRVDRPARRMTGEQGEVVHQRVQVDQGVAVEDADDPVVALHLLEPAVPMGRADQQGACAEHRAEPGDDLVDQGGHEVLGDRRDGREFARQAVDAAARDQCDGLGEQNVGVGLREQSPGLRQFDQPAAVRLPPKRSRWPVPARCPPPRARGRRTGSGSVAGL